MTKEEVSIKLKELRKRTGLSQPKFAKYLDISYKTYSQWEQRVAMPKDIDNLLLSIESKVIEYENSVMANSEKIASGKIKKKYYNNGIKNIMLLDGESVPNGFVPGMVKKSKEDKEKVNEKRKQTNLKKYGAATPLQSKKILEKTKQTNLERYGVENVSQAEEVREKVRDTMTERYGGNPMYLDEVKERIKKTNFERYGVGNPYQSEEIKEKIKQTNLERYGVEWNCLRPDIKIGSNNSGPNKEFAKLLDKNNIQYEREFALEKYSFDFKIGDILIEIDPWPTHNTAWNPFSSKCVRKTYHRDKSMTANNNGYRCIHVFDWDDENKVISLLKDRGTVYARKCEIREVPIKDANILLNTYHLQGTCKGQYIRYGLYYNDELISLMTFGKPRYNKNYQYELLRYCSTKNIVGGAERLFKHFISEHNPDSIISYCDRAKFSGEVYRKMGLKLARKEEPSCHWYSGKEKRHITDNFLRQRGFDQLFNESHGKGTSNEQLIMERGYFPIYDCGQAVYVWRKNNE